MLELRSVPFSAWGGFLLTLTIAFTAMVGSLLIGIPLAFMRLSDKPLVRTVARLYVEFWRAIPLITALFLSVALFPLLLPPGVDSDRFVAVLVTFTLFYGAYMAEVVRAGLVALPSGQREAAEALGLTKWRARDLVVIPQALTNAIPSIVNILIAVLKDTTLVLIIGMFDLLGMVHQSLLNVSWGGQAIEGYLFVALVMWTLCFSLSRASGRLERRH